MRKVRRMHGHPKILHGLVLAQLGTVAGAFLVNVLSARALGPEGRGEIALFLQLSYLIGAIAPLGRDRSVLRVDSEETSVRLARCLPWTIVRAPFFIAVGASAGLAGILTVLDMQPFVAVGFGLLLLGNLASRFYRAVSILCDDSWPFVVATLAGQMILVGSGGFLLGLKVPEAQIWILAYGVAMLLPFLLIAAYRPTFWKAENPTAWVEAKRMGIALLPSSVGEMLLTKMDRLLLPLLGTFSQLGYYAVAASLVDFALMPFRQHVDSRIPLWTRGHLRRELRIAPTVIRPLLFAAVLTAAVSALSAAFVAPVFGDSYAPAVHLIPWLAVATWIHIVTLYIYGHATALGHSRAATVMFLSGAAACIPLYFLLIPLHGAAGAAASLAVGYLVSAIVGGGLILVRRRDVRRSGADGNEIG